MPWYLGGSVSLLAGAVLVWLLARGAWRSALEPLAGARLEWMAAALGLALSVEVVKTVRWQLLLGAERSALPSLLALLLSARLLNAVAPLRAADLWRVAAVKAGGRPLVAAGGSLVAEKLLDGAILAAVGAVLVGSGLPAPGAALPVLGAIAIGAAAAGAIGWRLGWLRRARWPAGLAHLLRRGVPAWAAALSLVGMGLGLLVNLAVLEALGLETGPAAGAAMLVSAYAAGLVPAVPGQLGVFELAVSAPLMAMGYAPASAVAAAVGLHLVLLALLLVAAPASVLLARERNHGGEM